MADQFIIKLDDRSVKRFMSFTDRQVKEKRRDIVKGINAILLNINRDAKINAHVDDGTMRSSIGFDLASISQKIPAGHVTVKVPYGAFQDMGTGIQGAATYDDPLPSGYVHGSGTGVEATQYLTDAVNENRDKFEKVIRKALS